MASDAEPLLEVCDLGYSVDTKAALFKGVNFAVHANDIVVLQGKSGCGKTTLLKCLAHLNVYDGKVLYRGKTPKQHDIPTYRSRVAYVPQRPSLLPGTPRDFLERLSTLNAYRSEAKDNANAGRESFLDRAIRISGNWGVDEELWDRLWTTLSGGESQRIALAAAVGLNCAEILLLDEPTSALDADSSARVEKQLSDMLRAEDTSVKALVWITHSAEQAQRVGTRFVEITNGTCREILVNDAV
ncbi:hypothetical protein M0805_006839 [Coniferiporia weirii]|nr:hypothetical protein M0805_006839 [Coniferiporia weirii]